ncbi:TM2 domain-containing protein [Galbibacter pacificus]|uniref:TM2 domain-containing protein n=1 Tax=Galbibacter pacificus TaxID=2996052 RepID=A0ABT6FT37_9FLAO|nr:TM2 domain-containing protein [Galbibacter pacificus]MDG3582461.1 TM2 domain-containing protein [Galbibacter pacificus]MDG3586421.1 TM2 domain-containing protein [Galbibacter pacificus]
MSENEKDFEGKAKQFAKETSDEAKKTANEFSDGVKDALNQDNKKILAGILAIVVGALGIHKFILGYNKEGIIMLAVSIVLGAFTCGAGAGLMGIVGLIEGIIYLTKSDEEFYNTYQVGKKPWF